MSTDKTTTQLLAELSAVSNAVSSSEWSTGPLAGLPAPADFGALMSSPNPLATLSSSGVGMLTPHVSFLAKPLDQFRGDSGAVSAPAQGMATAATDVRALADTFRQTGTTETSGWTGEAADGHRVTSAQFAEGITAISEAAKTIAGAISGAGTEVVKALAEIIRLIGEAVGEMVPVMADGIARAPLTMGASIAEAIAKCVVIANKCGAKIAEVMANLLANAENLMKLVTMVLTIVDAVAQLLQKLAKLAQGSGGDAAPTGGDAAKSLEPGEKTATGQGQPAATGDPATEGTAESTDAGQATSGATDPTGTTTGGTDQDRSLPAGATTAVAAPSSPATPSIGTPSTSSPSTGASGGIPLGGVAPMAGAVSNTGTSGVRPPSRLAPGGSTFAVAPKETTAGRPATSATGTASSTGVPFMPMAMPGAGRGQGADDTDHERRYEVNADGDTFAAGDQDVIVGDSGVIGGQPAPEDDEWPRHATPAPAQPAPQENEARPAKVVWRLGENGALEATPAPEVR
ncbi:WXG100 family type VII secretion target [Saccharothrix sp. NRRL B-16348]|uniref:WXG100 family type VII secretion target n=1 Tax=Saccharothrix sp. NRRL B-16348 TaxID=1415542 RepID=UPI0006AFAEDD|nr:hypothetical protein [Saccharothrix sp. NRRL B-16348]